MTSSFNRMTPDSYSPDDVQQILQLAIARQPDTDVLTRGQLLEIAEELGISHAELQLAEQEWMLRRDADQERQTFNHYQRQQLQQHGIKYLIINAFLLLLNLITAGTVSWAWYVVLGWGLLLALHSWKSLQITGDEYEDRFQKWRRRRWFKKSVRNFLNRWMTE